MIEKNHNIIQNRVLWIDYIKGICILLVIMIHFTFTPQNLRDAYAPFLLIGFFFTSGYTHNIERTNFANFKIRVRSLFIPFLLLGFLNIAATQILTFADRRPLEEQIKNMFLQIRGQDDIIWFMPAMFVIDLVYHTIVHNIKNSRLAAAIIIYIAIAGVIYTRMGGEALPWHIQMIGIGCFWMYIGYLYKNYIEKRTEKVVNWFVTLASWTVYLTAVYLFNYLFGHQTIDFFCYGSNIILYLVESFMGLISITLLCKLLHKAKLLSFFGRNTLLYFALHGKIHSIVMTILNRTGIMPRILSNDLYLYITPILCTLIIAIALILPCIIINRYFPFLAGKSHHKTKNMRKADCSKSA